MGTVIPADAEVAALQAAHAAALRELAAVEKARDDLADQLAELRAR
jgi:hypothetical protein